MSSSTFALRLATGPTTEGVNKPVHTVRHRCLKAKVWKNDTPSGPMYNVTIARTFRDDKGEWQDSNSIGYDDLMNVSALMYETHAYISELRAKDHDARKEPAPRGQ